MLIEQAVQANLRLTATIQQLRDEIAVLKGEKGKPKFKPSGMEAKTEPGAKSESDGDDLSGEGSPKRPGSNKRGKTKNLTIHEKCQVPPSQTPPPTTPCAASKLLLRPPYNRRWTSWDVMASHGMTA